MSYLAPPPSAIGGSPGLSVTVGPPTANYPITSTAAAGGAAATINAAIATVNAAKGGTVWILGGGGTTYWLEAPLNLMPNVWVLGDGCTIEAMNSATFTPLVGTTTSITGITFAGVVLNANAANSGFSPVSLSVTTGTNVTYPTLTDQGTILVTPSAAVTSVTINGSTNFPLAGPWYITPTDIWQASFSSGQTFTYTQLIDAVWLSGMERCTIDFVPQGGAGTSTTVTAGCALVLDANVSSNKGNRVTVNTGPNSAGYFAACLRLNGSSSNSTTNNVFSNLTMLNCVYRGLDVATYSDTNYYQWVNIGMVASYGVLCWFGSGGTSSAMGKSPRQVIEFLTMASISGTDHYGVVLGYYQTSAAINPGVIINDFESASSAGGDYLEVIEDLRTTPVNDYAITDSYNGVIYTPQNIEVGEYATTGKTPVSLGTGSTSILSYTPTSAGLFRVTVSVIPTASSITGTITVTYEDPTAAGSVTQTYTIASGTSHVPISVTFLCNAEAGTAIAVAGTSSTASDEKAVCFIEQA